MYAVGTGPEARGWGLAESLSRCWSASRLRRSRLVCAGRSRPGDAHPAHRCAAPRRVVVGDHGASVSGAAHPNARAADGRWPLPHDDRSRPRCRARTTHPHVSGLVRALAAQPAVTRVWFDGDPPPADGVVAAIERADLVIFGPSNPYVSIDPILSRPGVRQALLRRRAVALSPIVAGQTIKGPLAAMIPALAGCTASAAAIAAHYGPLLCGLVVENGDEAGIAGLPVLATATVMKDRADRLRLGQRSCASPSRLPDDDVGRDAQTPVGTLAGQALCAGQVAPCSCAGRSRAHRAWRDRWVSMSCRHSRPAPRSTACWYSAIPKRCES